MKNLPQPSTQLQEVFRELLVNDKISVMQMLSDTGILHPKARIHDLRRLGVHIDCNMVKVKNKY